MNRFAARLLAVLGLVLLATAASAHPHVFVDARAEIVFDAEGKVKAVRHIWQFDEGFSVYATQGLDSDGDGKLSDKELAPLAKVNVESLAEYRFFTYLTVEGVERPFLPPTEYWLEFHGGRLTLFFTLPLDLPVAIPAEGTLEVYDPEYFVAFTFIKDNPFTLIDAPAACHGSFEPPQELDKSTQALLSQIPADQRVLPDALSGITSDLSNLILIVCGEAAPARSEIAAPAPGAGRGPFGVTAPETPGRGWMNGPLGGFFRWVAARQSEFYRQLTGAIGALKADGSAIWLLAGLSFLYGVFHAAGPGHGKAVLSAFLLSSGASLRRGVALSFAAAALQAFVAIALVAVAAAILNLTAPTMSMAANWLEIVSYAFIVVLGAGLLWRQLRPSSSHGHHHGHEDGHRHVRWDEHDDHHHHHVPDPATLQQPLGFRQAASAVAAIGIRPCSGAIIVLVFALAQGLFLAGIAATLVMAVGTGLTVAFIATLVVFARDSSLRFAGEGPAGAVAFGRVIGILGALGVLLLGLVLLIGKLAVGGP